MCSFQATHKCRVTGTNGRRMVFMINYPDLRTCTMRINTLKTLLGIFENTATVVLGQREQSYLLSLEARSQKELTSLTPQLDVSFASALNFQICTRQKLSFEWIF